MCEANLARIRYACTWPASLRLGVIHISWLSAAARALPSPARGRGWPDGPGEGPKGRVRACRDACPRRSALTRLDLAALRLASLAQGRRSVDPRALARS